MKLSVCVTRNSQHMPTPDELAKKMTQIEDLIESIDVYGKKDLYFLDSEKIKRLNQIICLASSKALQIASLYSLGDMEEVADKLEYHIVEHVEFLQDVSERIDRTY